VDAASKTPDERIERLLGEMDRAGDAEGRERSRALLDAVLAWHAAAITKLVALGGADLLKKAGADPQVASLLELHGLAGDAPTVTVERLKASASQVGRRDEPADACDACGVALPDVHEHLYDRDARTLACACGACAVASTKSRVRPHAERLGLAPWSDEEWDRLGIPIGLAFFQRSALTSQVKAFYPSPAGAVEAEAAAGSWAAVVAAHPAIGDLTPDVDALLIRRLGTARDCYRVSIDRAYELVAILRRGWRGLGGGADVWRDVAQFFERLDRGGPSHA
jgi:hypothetical protein